MQFKIIFYFINLLTISMLSLGCLNNDRCLNSNFCVHTEMPLLNQGALGLVNEVKSHHPSVVRDVGWCAPTASTMALVADINDSPDGVVFSPIFNDVVNGNIVESFGYSESFFDAWDRTSDYASIIYNIGESSGTNWVEGGTPATGTDRTFKFLYLLGLKNTAHFDSGYGYANFQPGVGNNTLINLFKAHKPGLVMSVRRFADPAAGFSKSMFIDWNAHLITLNGYEDGHLKIYDPWGRVYNIDINSTKNRVSFVSGSPNNLLFGVDLSGNQLITKANSYNYLYNHEKLQ